MSASTRNGTWAATRLSAIAHVIRGRVKPQDHPELPFVGMDNVEAHTMRLLGTVPSATMKSASVHFRPGDVLYGRLRPYLNKVLAPDFEGLASAEFIPLTTPDGILPTFLQYRLNAADFVTYASHLDEGDRPRVDYDQIGAFEIELPSSCEQRRIVEAIESYFTRLDDAVATLERVQHNLKRYRASVLKAAVEGRLVPTEAELARAEGRDYEPASVLLERILTERRRRWEEAELAKMMAKGKTPKDDKWKAKYKEPVTPNNDRDAALPDGWTWTSLESLTCSVRVICYGILMPKDNVPDGVPYVKVRDMRAGVLDVPSLQRTAPQIAAKYPRSVLRGGDLLLAIRGTYGRVVEIPFELEGGNITQDSARLDPLPGVNRRYAKWMLLSADTQKFFKRVARGVAVKGVNIADVRATPVALPPLAEQHRIVEEIEDLLSIEETHEAVLSASRARLGRLRQSILKWAFEGRLVDQDPTDEPASRLLERIQAEREASTARERRVSPRKRRKETKT